MSSKLDKSHVVVETANETYKLAYNVKSVRAISRQYHGLRQALEQVQNLNWDAIRGMIVTGADLDKQAARKLDDEIIETGLVEMVEPVSKFAMLCFTGKHPDYEDDEPEHSDEETKQGNASAD